MTITLESLLMPEQTQFESCNIEPIEAAMECGDAYAALCEAEQNCTTYEAAKIIKKNKSKSKKIKTTTSKMKAKDAKAKKAGGKVVKIKKVTKENDEQLDGATGPTPTTTDTNGLTDTDLDVDPEAEVEVTEVADDQPETQEESAWEGMVEGKDFVVEYEDASILALEDGEEKAKVNFKEALKNFWDKVVKFFQSIAAKIDEFLNFDKKFIVKNKDAIEKGLKTPGEVTLKADKAYATDLIGAFNNAMKTVQDELADADNLIKGGASKEDVNAVKKEAKKANPEEIKLADVKATYADLLKIVDDGRKDFKDLYAKAKKAGAEATSAAAKADKENASKIRLAGAKYQKTVSNAYREFGIIRSTAAKIAHAAAKAGGAKDTGAETPAEQK